MDEGVKVGLDKFREWLDGFGDPQDVDKADGNSQTSTYASKEMIFHKNHKSARTRWIAPADFPSQGIINAYLKPAVDKSKTRFSWGKPDLDRLQQVGSQTPKHAVLTFFNDCSYIFSFQQLHSSVLCGNNRLGPRRNRSCRSSYSQSFGKWFEANPDRVLLHAL